MPPLLEPKQIMALSCIYLTKSSYLINAGIHGIFCILEWEAGFDSKLL